MGSKTGMEVGGQLRCQGTVGATDQKNCGVVKHRGWIHEGRTTALMTGMKMSMKMTRTLLVPPQVYLLCALCLLSVEPRALACLCS